MAVPPNLRPVLWFLLHVSVLQMISSYSIFYAEDECRRTGTVLITLGRGNANSSGILKASRDGRQLPDMHCHITLKSLLSSEIVVSLRQIDLMPPNSCRNYLELNSSSDIRVKLCGYLYDRKEAQSYFSLGDMDLIFHTESVNTTTNTSGLPQTTQFEITFTGVNSAWLSKCGNREALCENGKCIWEGLVNDGHNNCGDFSDELTFNVSQENQLSAGLTLALIIPIIVVSLGLIVLLVCCFGQRVTAKIERLIQNEQRRAEARNALIIPNSRARFQNYNTAAGRRDADRSSYENNTLIRRDEVNAATNDLNPGWSAINSSPGRIVTNVETEEQLPPYEPPPSYETVTGETKEKY